MAEQKRILYLCSTFLSLMNCIVTQSTVNKEWDADIVFEDSSDFSEVSQRLMQYPIFKECYFFGASKGKARFNALPTKEEQREASHCPGQIYPIPEFKHSYTDFCVSLDTYAAKFLYYGLLERGMETTVHFVSEGTSGYAMDFENTARDTIDHEFYGERAFLHHIGNLYVYRPDLYTGESPLVNLVQLPNYAALPKELHELMTEVFGRAEPIREKLIFFEGTFWGDGMLTNEMHLFLAIADRVGRDNIIVKRHPRNTVDRFTPMGFKVMARQQIPWEVMLKDIDLSGKVCVSVASFTCFSSQEMYGRPSQSILLKNLMQGRVYFLENPGYRRFFRQAEKIFNQERIVSWSPSSMEELLLVLDSLGRKLGGWNA